jgi:hypothetical protein
MEKCEPFLRALCENLIDQDPALKTIGYSGRAVGYEEAGALADALETNPHLTTLGMWGNSMGTLGLKEISRALKINDVITTCNFQEVR